MTPSKAAPKKVVITVPSSSGNVGLGYDIWCLGLAEPSLQVTGTRTAEGATVEVRSPTVAPKGRQLGFAAMRAARSLLEEHEVEGGVRLVIEDSGYATGGLGRSGAEAAGAVMAAAALYGIKLTRQEAVLAAAKGEPGEHKDNVAGSMNGRFNIIAQPPGGGPAVIDVYDPPADLGIAIGFSSHQKTQGTEGLRQVLQAPVTPEDFVRQMGLVSAATAALVSGNTVRFLELAWGDRFHEPRRADAGGYGGFGAADLADLKRRLFAEHRIALNISGAGPNIQLLYSTKEHPSGVPPKAADLVRSWFQELGIGMNIRPTSIAREGSYDQALGLSGF